MTANRTPIFRRPKATWFGLALYVVGLLLPALHAADYGLAAHDHNGQACQIQHVSDNCGQALMAAVTVLPGQPAPMVAHDLAIDQHVVSRVLLPFAPRAPPA